MGTSGTHALCRGARAPEAGPACASHIPLCVFTFRDPGILVSAQSPAQPRRDTRWPERVLGKGRALCQVELGEGTLGGDLGSRSLEGSWLEPRGCLGDGLKSLPSAPGPQGARAGLEVSDCLCFRLRAKWGLPGSKTFVCLLTTPTPAFKAARRPSATGVFRREKAHEPGGHSPQGQGGHPWLLTGIGWTER